MPGICRRLLSLFAAVICVPVIFYTPLSADTSAPFQILTRLRNPIVWQNFGTCLMMTEDMADGRICYYYDYVTRSRMNIKAPQPGAWVPLGSAIKWLMYICQYQGLSRLMSHDVDNNVYSITRPSTQNQVGCGFVGTDCFYGQYRDSLVGDHYPVDIYKIHLWGGGGWEPVLISDSEKSQFAHDGNMLVYCAHYGVSDDRLCGLYFSGGDEFVIAAGNAIHPTVCGSLVAWAEPSGTGYNVLAKDISTGEVRTIAWTKANPPCPEAGRGVILWEDARNTATGLDIYGYDWATGSEFRLTSAAGDEVRLRVCDDLVTWVKGPANYEVLWGAKITPSSQFGTISGTVTDSDGIGVAGVVLTTDVGGHSATTGANGSFVLPNIGSGEYNLTASKFGYASQVRPNVAVVPGQTSLVNVAIERIPDAGSAANARGLADGTTIALFDKVIYLKQGDFGYIAEPNRSGGMRIQGDIPVSTSKLVSVVGSLSTSSGGERYIQLEEVVSGDTVSVRPVGVSIRDLPTKLLDGLYIRTWGTVKPQSVTDNSFVISDGPDAVGIRVITQATPAVTAGAFVTVTGAAGYDNGRIIIAE